MHVPVNDGHWVSEHYERLARVVEDYDPQFELRWIPPENRSDPEDRKSPYCIWDTVTNSPVFYASELDTPEVILTRLFDADNKHGDVLKRLDAHNAAVKVLEMKKNMDISEERQDFVKHLFTTPKHYITLPGGRKVDDHMRPI